MALVMVMVDVCGCVTLDLGQVLRVSNGIRFSWIAATVCARLGSKPGRDSTSLPAKKLQC